MRRAVVAITLLAVACSAPSSAPNPSTAAPVTTSPAATTIGTPTPTPTPSATPIPLPAQAEVAAASGGVIWMWVNGDHLFMSLNRGDTWTERSLPSSARCCDIAFVSAGDGWLLQPSPAPTQGASQDFTLWRTVNGAITWTKLDASGVASARCKGPIAFSDSGTGFIGVWDDNGPPAIYRTTDAGRTWALTSPLPDPPGFVTRGGGVTLRPATIAYFGASLYVGAVGFSTAANYAFRSTDGGASWSYLSTGPVLQVPIVFVTPTRWVQIVAPSQSRETTDGGRSWHAFASDYQTAAPFPPQIAFGDADTGYATVRGTLARTTDGGVHWTSLKTPGT